MWVLFSLYCVLFAARNGQAARVQLYLLLFGKKVIEWAMSFCSQTLGGGGASVFVVRVDFFEEKSRLTTRHEHIHVILLLLCWIERPGWFGNVESATTISGVLYYLMRMVVDDEA